MAKEKKPEGTGVDVLTELGIPGLRHVFGKVAEEWLPALEFDNQIRTYVEMRDSPALGTALLVMETFLRRTEFTVTSADSKSPAAEQCAEEFDGALHDMDGTFQDHQQDAWTMLWAGHAPFEYVWKRRLGMTPGVDANGKPLPKSRFSDGKLGIHKLAFRAQESIDRWEFLQDGSYVGFHQVDPNTYGYLYIPMEKVLHYRLRPHKNNPQGNSLFRIAYNPYTFGKKLHVVRAVGFERNAYGVPIATVPERYLLADATPAQKQVVAQLYNQIRGFRRDVNEGVVMPGAEDAAGKTGFGLVAFQGGGSERNMGIRETILDYRKEELTCLVCEMLALGMDKVGTQGAAEVKQGTLGMVLEAIADAFLDTFNAGPPLRFAVLNGYAPEDAPKVTRGKIVTPSMSELAAYFAPLIQAGMPTDDGLWDFLRMAGGAPPPDLQGKPTTG